jgi:hypothetical protein
MRGRVSSIWVKVLLATALTAAMTLAGVTGAGASGAFDLTTKSGINSYLISKGVDPASVVWQQSLRNYAGPSCPGIGWNCVGTKAPVVQFALPGGTNVFSCPGVQCFVIQSSPSSSQNSAQCKRTGQDESQTCDVTQNNTKSTNNANIEQTIAESGGCDQTATESASVSQTNGSGANHSRIQQRITQTSKTSGNCDLGTQSQEARQGAKVDQSTTTGDNFSDINQSQKQTESSSGGTSVTQLQNTGAGTTEPCSSLNANNLKNECADVTQTSNTGDQDSTLNQAISQDETASNSGAAIPLTQMQGTLDGGQGGNKIQNSSGVSTGHASQPITQHLSATGAFSPVVRSFDTGDPRCCWMQTGNANDQAFIDQDIEQLSNEQMMPFIPHATENAVIEADCDTTGNCTAKQSWTTDFDSDSTTTSGTSVHNTIFCGGSGGEGFCGED